MDIAARQFARKVLLIHLALTLLVVMLILGAWREIYSETRHKVLDQAAKRQDMLADQTARGIESHFNSIISNLELVDVNRPLPNAPTPLVGASPAASAV